MDQNNGDVIMADQAHSVFGLSCINLAWNVCYPSFLETYVQRATRVTDYIRRHHGAGATSEVAAAAAAALQEFWNEHPGRSFSLGPCLLKGALRASEQGWVSGVVIVSDCDVPSDIYRGYTSSQSSAFGRPLDLVCQR